MQCCTMVVCSRRSCFIYAFGLAVAIMFVANSTVVFDTVTQRLQNSSIQFYLRGNNIAALMRYVSVFFEAVKGVNLLGI